jgi:uncharacterized protein with HEPN domain
MVIRSLLLRIHDMLESIRGIRGQPSSRSRFEGTAQGRWEDIAGIGNLLRHEYQHVDAAIIWKTVKNDLPPLKDALLALRASLKS